MASCTILLLALCIIAYYLSFSLPVLFVRFFFIFYILLLMFVWNSPSVCLLCRRIFVYLNLYFLPFILLYLTLLYFALPYCPILLYLTLPYLTLSHLTQPHLTLASCFLLLSLSFVCVPTFVNYLTRNSLSTLVFLLMLVYQPFFVSGLFVVISLYIPYDFSSLS